MAYEESLMVISVVVLILVLLNILWVGIQQGDTSIRGVSATTVTVTTPRFHTPPFTTDVTTIGGCLCFAPPPTPPPAQAPGPSRRQPRQALLRANQLIESYHQSLLDQVEAGLAIIQNIRGNYRGFFRGRRGRPRAQRGVERPRGRVRAVRDRQDLRSRAETICRQFRPDSPPPHDHGVSPPRYDGAVRFVQHAGQEADQQRGPDNEQSRDLCGANLHIRSIDSSRDIDEFFDDSPPIIIEEEDPAYILPDAHPEPGPSKPN